MTDSKEENSKWRELLYEFTQDTTLHGIRYTTSSQSYWLRRIIWVLILMGAFAVFLTMVIGNLVKFYGYPKTVSVDVVYEKSLSFPGVTICNINMFRLTKAYEQGLYDRLSESYPKFEAEDMQTMDHKDGYIYLQGYCLNSSTLAFNSPSPNFTSLASLCKGAPILKIYEELTLKGCMTLCSMIHTEDCSKVVYGWKEKQCILFTGVCEQLFDGTTLANHSCYGTAPDIEIYDRVLYSDDIGNMTCDWEDAKECKFSQRDNGLFSEGWESFEMVSAKQNVPATDHTFNSDTGHFFRLQKFESMEYPTFAKIELGYYRFHQSCLEFYYQQTGTDTISITIYLKDKDYNLKTIDPLPSYFRKNHWNRAFARIEDGIRKVIIFAVRPSTPGPGRTSGFALDDLIIRDCSFFERDCKRTRLGIDYQGNTTVSSSGKTCTSACRNYDYDRQGPSCRVIPKEGETYSPKETCNINFCECQSSEFRCSDGFCIPEVLKCNGNADCIEGEDETEPCTLTVKCEFEDSFICGYKFWDHDSAWRRINALDFFEKEEAISKDYQGTSLGHFMDSYSSQRQEGDRALLISPRIEIRDENSLLKFHIFARSTTGGLRLLASTSNIDAAVFVDLKYNMTSNWNVWTEDEIRLPVGNYSIIFEATKGSSFISDLAIDNIQIRYKTNDENVVNVTQDEVTLKSNGSFDGNCNFSAENWCGYKNYSFSSKVGFHFLPTRMLEYVILGRDEEIHTENYGNIKSPNYPDLYENNMEKIYLIVGPKGSYITLNFRGNFSIDYYDSLKIQEEVDGTTVTTYVKGVNRPSIQSYQSNTSIIMVNFTTNYYYNAVGFSAEFYIHQVEGTDYSIGVTVDSTISESKEASLTSPLLEITKESCLVAMIRSVVNFEICIINAIGTSKEECTDYPPTENVKKPVDLYYRLKVGSYYIKFGFTISYEEKIQVYAALDEIKIIQTECSLLNEVQDATGSCDFTEQNACGYRETQGIWTVYTASRASTLMANDYNYMRCMSANEWTSYSSQSPPPLNSWLSSSSWYSGSSSSYYTSYPSYYSSGYSSSYYSSTSNSGSDYYSYSTSSSPDYSSSSDYGDSSEAHYGESDYVEPDYSTSYASSTIPSESQYYGSSYSTDYGAIYSSSDYSSSTADYSYDYPSYSTSYDTSSTSSLSQIQEPSTSDSDVIPTTTMSTDMFQNSWIIGSTKGPSQGSEENVYYCQCKNGGPCQMESPKFSIASDSCLQIMFVMNSCNYTNITLYFFDSLSGNFLGNIDVSGSLAQRIMQLDLKKNVAQYSMLAQAYGATIALYKIQIVDGNCIVNDTILDVSTEFKVPDDDHKTGDARTTSSPNQDNANTGTEGSTPVFVDKTTKRSVSDDVNIKQFLEASKHEYVDFIHICSWKGGPCDKNHFVEQFTDMGLCYTFNGNTSLELKSSTSGSDQGLQLTLNLANYDRAGSELTDSGVMVYLHEPENIPMVSEMGFAAPAGLHTLVSASYSETNNLKRPYGNCTAENNLEYYQGMNYTMEYCRTECKTKATGLICGCKHAFMSDVAPFPLCSMSDYIRCGLNFKGGLNGSLSTCEKEKCQVACKMINYQIMSSSSKLTTVDLNNRVSEKFYSALEIKNRADPTRIVSTVRNLDKLILSINYYKDMAERQTGTSPMSRYTKVVKAMNEIQTQIVIDCRKVLDDLKHIRSVYMDIFGYRINALHYKLVEVLNYARSMVQRNSQGDCYGGMNDNLTIRLLRDVQKSLYDVKDGTEKEFLNRLRNYMKSYNTSNVEGLSGEEIANLIPDNIGLNNSYGYCVAQDVYSEFLDIFNNVFKGVCMDEGQYLNFVKAFDELKHCNEEFGLVLDKIDRAIGEMRKLEGPEMSDSYELDFNFEFESQNLTKQFDKYAALSQRFRAGKITKSHLSEDLDLKNIFLTINQFRQFQNSIGSKITEKLMESTKTLEHVSLDLYNAAVEALVDLQTYYKKEHLDLEKRARALLIWRKPEFSTDTEKLIELQYEDSTRLWSPNRNFYTFVKSQAASGIIRFVVKEVFQPLRKELNDITFELNQELGDVQMALDDIKKEMEAFQQSQTMDKDFVRNNFLKLDVYYGELKKEIVTLSVGYTMASFWSDLGGYLGLLLGASVVTVCEFLDLVFSNAIHIRKRRTQVEEMNLTQNKKNDTNLDWF